MNGHADLFRASIITNRSYLVQQASYHFLRYSKPSLFCLVNFRIEKHFRTYKNLLSKLLNFVLHITMKSSLHK